MQITNFGHACLLIGSDQTRLLIDPGTYSAGFEHLTGLDAIAVTHQHPDHLDPACIGPLSTANPGVRLLVESETVAALELRDPMPTTVTPGFATRIGDFDITAVGGRHAANHDQVPPLGNVGFLLTCQETTVFHPGDCYDARPDGVDLLGLPLNAPWCRMSETLDFLHAVAPRVAIAIHTGLLNDDGLAAYLMHVRRFGPPGCEVVALGRGSTYDV